MNMENQQSDIYEIKIDDTNDVETDDNIESSATQDEDSSKKIENADFKTEVVAPTDQNYYDQLQRLKAEFSNYKKRMENEKILLSEIIKGEVIKGLLPVIDDFDRLLQHVNDEGKEIVKGISLIYKKLIETLKQQGLKQVKSVGEKFNPNFHEALLVDHHEGAEEDIVMEEWRKGYIFKNRLLRPAQVKVNKIQN